MQTSAWLGKLTNAPGPRGAALQHALLTCIAHTANSPTTGQGHGPGQGWQLVSRPVITFAVALLEKGNVKAAELADALSGNHVTYSTLWFCTVVLCLSVCLSVCL